MPARDTANDPLTVSIIVPARDEESSLSDCLTSLVAQQAVAFEIIVIDDHSTDRTSEIASSFSASGVKLIRSPELPVAWTGKNNAVAAAAKIARGEWLLFTDADTIHL
ncbi:MAG: glycosyltransferase family A protein, partial [Candidatus Sulfotelmatobacter sp.]